MIGSSLNPRGGRWSEATLVRTHAYARECSWPFEWQSSMYCEVCRRNAFPGLPRELWAAVRLPGPFVWPWMVQSNLLRLRASESAAWPTRALVRCSKLEDLAATVHQWLGPCAGAVRLRFKPLRGWPVKSHVVAWHRLARHGGANGLTRSLITELAQEPGLTSLARGSEDFPTEHQLDVRRLGSYRHPIGCLLGPRRHDRRSHVVLLKGNRNLQGPRLRHCALRLELLALPPGVGPLVDDMRRWP